MPVPAFMQGLAGHSPSAFGEGVRKLLRLDSLGDFGVMVRLIVRGMSSM